MHHESIINVLCNIQHCNENDSWISVFKIAGIRWQTQISSEENLVKNLVFQWKFNKQIKKNYLTCSLSGYMQSMLQITLQTLTYHTN